jgi:hypothetical protein
VVRSYLRDVSRSFSSVHRLVVGSRAGRWGARRGVEPVRPETSRNGSYVCVRMCVCVCVCVRERRMPWRSRCLCIGYRAVPWCPLSSSKLPDTYAIHLHLHLLILLVILSSRHSSVYYYTPSLPPLVPNRSTDIWTLPLADITAATAAVLLDKPILRPRHQPLNTSLDIYAIRQSIATISTITTNNN